MDDQEGDVFQGIKAALYVEALVAMAIAFIWWRILA